MNRPACGRAAQQNAADNLSRIADRRSGGEGGTRTGPLAVPKSGDASASRPLLTAAPAPARCFPRSGRSQALPAPTALGFESYFLKKQGDGTRSRLPVGGEGGTRTLAPVSRPTPLAGAPRHQLEYFSIPDSSRDGWKRPKRRIHLKWTGTGCLANKKLRRAPGSPQVAERKGFEPLALSSHWFSRPAP